jgi:glutathione S-transferase
VKLYVWHKAPNPRRVLLYLAEKGIAVPLEDVGGDKACLKPEYVARYPQATVPMLELDDGMQIGEAMAICRYFEEVHPDPPLMGRDAREKAIVEMWERRAYEEGLIPAAEIFRNSHPLFADRGVAGSSDPVPQIPALVERGRLRLKLFFAKFDAQLAAQPFVAGRRFTVADATTLAAVDFAAAVAREKVPEGCRNLGRWHAEVSARPSAKAGIA